MPAAELTAARSTHRKFLWIRQVCADPQLRHLPCRIAALMLDYINLKSQVAWPSQQTLVAAAGVTPRAVQTALRCLEQSGHITARRSPGRVNLYRPQLTNDRSSVTASPLNRTSKTDERRFTRNLETPLNKSLNEAERAEIGRKMKELGAQISGRKPTLNNEGLT
ncbi:helix-turn-helix domain-containing protein [Brevundimonas sp.]|uniref:helix-turn-helix domain-containing protein n=1 Tax=Brevundimonas sp. TaxID=1871086 RepID=UPI0028B01A36|nr:helix-turn-helix domain-containing protein [Brevundimonas sp.]